MKPERDTKSKADAARAREHPMREQAANGHVDPLPMDRPDSSKSENDELDVDELDRKARERIAYMSSPLNRPPNDLAVEMTSILQSCFGVSDSHLGVPETKKKAASRVEAADSPSLQFNSSSFGAVTVDLEDLVREGHDLKLAILVQKKPERIKEKLPKERKKKLSGMDVVAAYKPWYDKSRIVISQLLPEKRDEFKSYCQYPLIRGDHVGFSRRLDESLRNHVTGEDATGLLSGYHLLEAQCEILEQAKLSFDLSLAKSQQALQADLLDSVLCAARDFYKKGDLRAAGTMAGVVLEQHLRIVLKAHSVRMRKKNISINDYSLMLKDKDIAEFPVWRTVQRLGNLQELCRRADEPKKEDVEELINGVDKIIKTLF